MGSRTWPSSPLDAAQRAFDLLVCPPAPLGFDTRGIEGLPQQMLPLDELRDLLLKPDVATAVRDSVWRRKARSTGHTVAAARALLLRRRFDRMHCDAPTPTG